MVDLRNSLCGAAGTGTGTPYLGAPHLGASITDYALDSASPALFSRSPTSTAGDEFTARMFAALNAMMLDMLAAVARKDYEDRRRQAQGIAKAKAAGAYRGRPEDTARNAGIAGMLRSGMSWSSIQAATGCSRATIAKVRARAA